MEASIHVQYLRGKVRRRFRHEFQDVTIPHKEKLIHAFGNASGQTGSLIKKITMKMVCVLTEEKLDEIGAVLELSPGKPRRRLAQEIGV
jgi:hypothetical protein